MATTPDCPNPRCESWGCAKHDVTTPEQLNDVVERIIAIVRDHDRTHDRKRMTSLLVVSRAAMHLRDKVRAALQ